MSIERNARVQARYDELRREGKHGHYETMFRVVSEEVQSALEKAEQERDAALAQVGVMREAAARLSNEVIGADGLFEAIARRELGNTNYTIIMQRAHEVRAAIAATPPSSLIAGREDTSPRDENEDSDDRRQGHSR